MCITGKFVAESTEDVPRSRSPREDNLIISPFAIMIQQSESVLNLTWQYICILRIQAVTFDQFQCEFSR